MTGPLPWTRFSYDDFFDDPAVAAMSNEEIGAYLRLLRACWRSKTPGVIPNVTAFLANVSQLGPSWPEHATSILAAFKVQGDNLVQSRVVEEYETGRG